MIDELTNIAIAEVMGVEWCDHSSRENKFCPHCGYGMLFFSHIDKNRHRPCPYYTSDLNEMHEAEKWLFASKPGYYERAYFGQLVEVVVGENPLDGWDGDLKFSCYAACATAEQRARAFLKTLNLWKE